jgi:SAM-dependent methyltransferase
MWGSISLIWFALALAAGPKCELTLTASWSEASARLLAALKSKTPAEFPAEIGGRSLIPPRVLETLNEHLKDAKLEEIETIALETWHDRDFVIALKYRAKGSRELRFLGTFQNEFFLWRNYYRAAARGAEPYALELAKLPVAEQKIDAFRKVRENDFNVGRPYSEYNGNFEGRLSSFLRRLGATGWTWIDMGAGYALAQHEYWRRWKRRHPRAEEPNLIAVGYKIPGGEPTKAALPFSYIEGKQGPTSLLRLPKADLITDVMGIYTYAKNPHEILRAYAGLLKPGGVLLIHTYELDARSREWLENRKDLELRELDVPGSYAIARSIRRSGTSHMSATTQ